MNKIQYDTVIGESSPSSFPEATALVHEDRSVTLITDGNGIERFSSADEARRELSKYILSGSKYRLLARNHKSREEECHWHDLAEEQLGALDQAISRAREAA